MIVMKICAGRCRRLAGGVGPADRQRRAAGHPGKRRLCAGRRLARRRPGPGGEPEACCLQHAGCGTVQMQVLRGILESA